MRRARPPPGARICKVSHERGATRCRNESLSQEWSLAESVSSSLCKRTIPTISPEKRFPPLPVPPKAAPKPSFKGKYAVGGRSESCASSLLLASPAASLQAGRPHRQARASSVSSKWAALRKRCTRGPCQTSHALIARGPWGEANERDASRVPITTVHREGVAVPVDAFLPLRFQESSRTGVEAPVAPCARGARSSQLVSTRLQRTCNEPGAQDNKQRRARTVVADAVAHPGDVQARDAPALAINCSRRRDWIRDGARGARWDAEHGRADSRWRGDRLAHCAPGAGRCNKRRGEGASAQGARGAASSSARHRDHDGGRVGCPRQARARSGAPPARGKTPANKRRRS